MAKKEIDHMAQRLLIMATPNDIFQSLDACETSKDIWDQLANQLEGGINQERILGIDALMKILLVESDEEIRTSGSDDDNLSASTQSLTLSPSIS